MYYEDYVNNEFDFNFVRVLKAFKQDLILNCEFNSNGDCVILFKYCGKGNNNASRHDGYLSENYLYEFNIAKDGKIKKCYVYEKDFLNNEEKGDLICKITYEEDKSLITKEIFDEIFAKEKEKLEEISNWADVFYLEPTQA